MKKLIRNGQAFGRNVAKYGVGVAVAGGLASGAHALDVTAATTELADAATSAGTVVVAALGVAAVLMAGFMIVRRL